jgi:hypothetical protein
VLIGKAGSLSKGEPVHREGAGHRFLLSILLLDTSLIDWYKPLTERSASHVLCVGRNESGKFFITADTIDMMIYF